MNKSAGFDLFIEQVFSLYTALSTSSNREYVIGAGSRALRVLRNFKPADDDEEINVETAIELIEELVRKAGGTL